MRRQGVREARLANKFKCRSGAALIGVRREILFSRELSPRYLRR